MTKRLSRQICAFMLLAICVAAAEAQDRTYTEFEIERFDLNKRFEAEVLLDDGKKIFLKDFRLGEGLYRFKLQVGTQSPGLTLPLTNIRRIVRSGDSPEWVDVVFLNGSEMHTRWNEPSTQLVIGIREDGSRWVERIDNVREIVVREVAHQQEEPREN